jgi:hypothetical protein
LGVTVAMVTLTGNFNLSGQTLEQSLKTDWPETCVKDLEEKDQVLSFQIGSCMGFVSLMEAPIPWGDLDEACATSVLWPNAEATLRTHSMHMVVAVTGEASAIERSRLLTQIIASLIQCVPPLSGVYWGAAGLVISPAMFREFATEILPEGPPLHMWVNFRVGRNDKGTTSGFTRGLAALDLMDIETDSSIDSPSELRERLESIAGYLLGNGLVIADGDSLGESETEKIRVVYAPSQFGSSEKVMRLEFENPKKPLWKIW